MKYHPDKVRCPKQKKINNEKFRMIVGAYEVLSDENQRREYDEYRLQEQRQGQENPFRSSLNLEECMELFRQTFETGCNIGTSLTKITGLASLVVKSPFWQSESNSKKSESEELEKYIYGAYV